MKQVKHKIPIKCMEKSLMTMWLCQIPQHGGVTSHLSWYIKLWHQIKRTWPHCMIHTHSENVLSFMIRLNTQTHCISDYQRQKSKLTHHSHLLLLSMESNISVTQSFKYLWDYKNGKLKLLVHATRGQPQVESFILHQHYLSLKRVKSDWK